MHIFLNALGATCASGFTYLRNVLPQFSAQAGVKVTVAVNRRFRAEVAGSANISLCDCGAPEAAARRFLFEQAMLPGCIRRVGADVLISAGNFALRNSPVPQILLSGNSLYTCPEFRRDLRSREEYGLLTDHCVKSFFAKRSISWSDVTIAPSRTFGEELRTWTGKQIHAIYHGFDQNVFFGDGSPLPDEIKDKLDSARDSVRLLFVSHYNYYRNFETLLSAISILRTRPRKKVRLFLTCHLQAEDNPGSYRADRAATLVRKLGIQEEVVELGSLPYSMLHRLYSACDIYVSPAYAESFAHPLVEAMACGMPVVASDLPVHQEICGRAARYFPRFSPEDLCALLMQVANSSTLRRELSNEAKLRAQNFSWGNHVRDLIALARELTQTRGVPRESTCPDRYDHSKLHAI